MREQEGLKLVPFGDEATFFICMFLLQGLQVPFNDVTASFHLPLEFPE